jgi:hypoxanthine phosphoribosyltransferase
MTTSIQIHDKTFRPFLSAEEIAGRIKALAAETAPQLAGKRPLFIVVLKGAFVFAADLLRQLPFEAEVAFVQLHSYAGTTSTGTVKTVVGLPNTLADRHVVLIEDIVDTGRTIDYLLREAALQKPASIHIATFLFKPAALQFPTATPHFVAFEIPNHFVVGYGLDYNGLGRNLPELVMSYEL